MAALSTHREAIQYVSDDGNTYQVTAQSAVATQGALGGVVAAGTEPTYPQKWIPRKAVFRTSDLTPNVGREVTVYTPTAFAAIVRGTTLNLNHANDSHSFKATGTTRGEVRDVRNVTLQIT
jgi:hypothetical protein